jgi:hypothetical protein
VPSKKQCNDKYSKPSRPVKVPRPVRLVVAGLVAFALQLLAAATAVARGSFRRLFGGTLPMNLQARLDTLQNRHASLETRICDEDQRPRPDSEALTRLKVEKLRVKEEMERLRSLPH